MSTLPPQYLDLKDEPLFELVCELWERIEELSGRIDDLEHG